MLFISPHVQRGLGTGLKRASSPHSPQTRVKTTTEPGGPGPALTAHLPPPVTTPQARQQASPRAYAP